MNWAYENVCILFKHFHENKLQTLKFQISVIPPIVRWNWLLLGVFVLYARWLHLWFWDVIHIHRVGQQTNHITSATRKMCLQWNNSNIGYINMQYILCRIISSVHSKKTEGRNNYHNSADKMICSTAAVPCITGISIFGITLLWICLYWQST